jgi:hypothetical protein
MPMPVKPDAIGFAGYRRQRDFGILLGSNLPLPDQDRYRPQTFAMQAAHVQRNGPLCFCESQSSGGLKLRVSHAQTAFFPLGLLGL